MARKSTRAHDHAAAPLSPAVDSPRTRGVFYRKGSGRAKLGLRVFSERDPQPLGSKTAIARRSPPDRNQNREPAAIHLVKD